MSIASPCINICRMNAQSGYCEGCFRTVEEITRWSGDDDVSRQRVLVAVEQRRVASLAPGRGPKLRAGGRS